jgi:predicted RNase H-like nuclease (RuvC/YqgF family)
MINPDELRPALLQLLEDEYQGAAIATAMWKLIEERVEKLAESEAEDHVDTHEQHSYHLDEDDVKSAVEDNMESFCVVQEFRTAQEELSSLDSGLDELRRMVDDLPWGDVEINQGNVEKLEKLLKETIQRVRGLERMLRCAPSDTLAAGDDKHPSPVPAGGYEVLNH